MRNGKKDCNNKKEKTGPSKAQLFLSDLYFTTFVERFWETGRSEYIMAKVLGISKSERMVSTYVCDDVMHSGPKTVRSICAIRAYGEKENRWKQTVFRICVCLMFLEVVCAKICAGVLTNFVGFRRNPSKFSRLMAS